MYAKKLFKLKMDSLLLGMVSIFRLLFLSDKIFKKVIY